MLVAAAVINDQIVTFDKCTGRVHDARLTIVLIRHVRLENRLGRTVQHFGRIIEIEEHGAEFVLAGISLVERVVQKEPACLCFYRGRSAALYPVVPIFFS